ncbi:MAG: MBOAT family O-acyltransferase [Bacteriovoracaceae bacterium]
MLFNSLEFLLFIAVFCSLFKFSHEKHKINLFLIGSYLFYAAWEWKYLGLILISTIVDYKVTLNIEKSKEDAHRKRLLILSLMINLGILCIFKYFNFFSTSFFQFLSLFGLNSKPYLLKLLLPVGISFYTFQSMSYTIDVYKKQRKACQNFGLFAAYVAYFPQLVAGPIERSDRLIPQLLTAQKPSIKSLEDGLHLIVIGFFKKVVIADRLAIYVDNVFSNPNSYNNWALLIASYFFSIQIYCDFSGYTDIARGISRLFNVDLMKNFSHPYFAKDIKDFWSRWHISLTTWFRDYLYIPLGGNKKGKFRTLLNIFIVFLVSALWHGANWTFIIWGLIHFLLYFGHSFVAKLKVPIPRLIKVFLLFNAVTLAWIFFRSDSLTQAVDIIARIFSGYDFQLSAFANALTPFTRTSLAASKFIVSIGLIFLLLILDLKEAKLIRLPFNKNWQYAIIILVILTLGEFGENNFIYFQF